MFFYSEMVKPYSDIQRNDKYEINNLSLSFTIFNFSSMSYPRGMDQELDKIIYNLKLHGLF